jgi:hypothetical protein
MDPARVDATARIITNAADCDVYHAVEIPGYGLLEGTWDLLGRVPEYLAVTSPPQSLLSKCQLDGEAYADTVPDPGQLPARLSAGQAGPPSRRSPRLPVLQLVMGHSVGFGRPMLPLPRLGST